MLILPALATAYQAQATNDAHHGGALVSFALDPTHTLFRHFDHPIFRMLDSGAHSVWSSGGTIKLEDYMRWAREECEATSDMIRVVNLDVIPGARAVSASRAEILRAAEAGVENAERMRAEGFRVCEVYHLWEPIGVWEAMIERRRDGEAIGIGGLGSGATRAQRTAFADAAFAVLKSMCGWDALPPVHGFGISSAAACRYPLASIDSSSYAAPERWGRTPVRFGFTSKTDGGLATRQRAGKVYYMHVYFSEWQKLEQTMARQWASRGVRILEERRAL